MTSDTTPRPAAAGDAQDEGEADRVPGLSRRRFLRAAGGAGLLGAVGYLLARGMSFRSAGAPRPRGPVYDVDRADLDELAANITSGGPPKDGIPPIDEPRFVRPAQAPFLFDDDVVFGVAHAGEVRAYPQPVLVWHEIVNDHFPDGPLTVTYCPLTGSAVAFRGTAPDGSPYTFGTSGDLVNSNLLMYDRQTDSRWPQILGQAIVGPARGQRLEELPVLWTTWGRWRQAHPGTVVLSTDTGHLRDYGRDPYGSYRPRAGYYEMPELLFPVLHVDGRFTDKERFLGAKLGGARLAVRHGLLRERGAVSAEMAGAPVVFLYDPALDDGRAFVAEVDGRALHFTRSDGPGRHVDASTRSRWDPEGRALAGPLAGAELPRVLSYDVMWFAWAAFFPDAPAIG